VKQHEQGGGAGGPGGPGGGQGFPGGFRFSTGGGGGGGFDPFMIFEQMFGSRGFPGGGGGGRARGGGRGRGGGAGSGGGDFFSGTEVESITAQNAKTVIGKDLRKQDGRIWTIMFYAPWCGHCQAAKGDFISFAKKAKGVVRAGAVDCDQNQNLCAHYKVQGFPTFISLMPDSSNPIPYNGPRAADGFYDHSQRLIPSKFVTVVATEEQAKAHCEKTPQKICVVLLSDKATPTPLLKALAYRTSTLATTVLVKGVNAASRKKSIVFGDSSTTTPALFVNGKLYKGVIRMDEVYKFVVNESKSGKKQQQQQQQKKGAKEDL